MPSPSVDPPDPRRPPDWWGQEETDSWWSDCDVDADACRSVESEERPPPRIRRGPVPPPVPLAVPAPTLDAAKAKRGKKTRKQRPKLSRTKTRPVVNHQASLVSRWVWDPCLREACEVHTVSATEGFGSQEEAEEFGLCTDHDPPPGPYAFNHDSLASLFTLSSDFGSEEAASLAVQFVLAFVCGIVFLRRQWLAKQSKRCVIPFLAGHMTNYNRAVASRATRKVRRGLASAEILKNVPPTSYLAFTDGSAIPNPGPSGAGVWASIPGNSPIYLYQSLGIESNNNGELWAIGMALQYYIDEKLNCDIVIATDSDWAIGKITKGHRSKGKARHSSTVSAINKLIASINRPIQFIWVHAHSGHAYNEIADHLAKLGSKVSRTSGIPVRDCYHEGFTYVVKGTRLDPHIPPD